MLLLAGTSDLIRVVTDSAGDIEVHASFVEHNGGAITPLRTNTASITTATTTTVVSSPAASTQRNVKHLNIRNNHASVINVVTVTHDDGTNVSTLFAVTLMPGESLVLDETGRWTHYDENAAKYPVIVFASQAQMETPTSLSLTTSPGQQHFHPGHTKCWGKATVSGGTPTLQTSYNITSITDAAQGRLQFTIATDFSSVNYSCIGTVERASTSLAAANARMVNVENNAFSAGAVLFECGTGFPNPTNETLEDPSAWHMVAFGDQA